MGTVGLAQAQGRRPHMDDFCIATPLQHPNLSEAALVGVFDGHGGDGIARLACKVVPETVQEYLAVLTPDQQRDPIQVRRAIKNAFLQSDDDFEAPAITYQRRLGGGNTSSKRVPCAGSDEKRRSPPYTWASLRDKPRPKPVPAAPLVLKNG